SEGCIVLMNAELERMFGYPDHELLGKNVEVLLPEKLRTAHSHFRQNFFRTPETRRMSERRELLGLRRNGTEFCMDIGLCPVQTEKSVVVLANIVDAGVRLDRHAEQALELKRANEALEHRTRSLSAQAEELRRANEALERSNIELQQFVYIASDDLKSPLRNIAGFVQLLKLEYENKLDAQGRDWIDRSVLSIQHMEALIRDLLAYSRVN